MTNRNPLEKWTLRQLMQVKFLGIPYPIAAVISLVVVLAIFFFG